MATKLKNMRLTSVDLVRAGANQEADICLYKSATPPEATESPTSHETNIFKRFIAWLRENPTEAQDEPQNPIEKADEPADLETIYKTALAESIRSIYEDPNLTSTERLSMVEKSVDQYTEKMKEIPKEEEFEEEEEIELSADDPNRFEELEETRIHKFNPYHASDGRFSDGGSAASFTFHTNSQAGQKAIANIKAKQQAAVAGGGKSAYQNKIKDAKDLDTLNKIVEDAANDDSLSNEEYEAIYSNALSVAQSWQPQSTTKSEFSADDPDQFDEIDEVHKFNQNHASDGKFTTSGGGGGAAPSPFKSC